MKSKIPQILILLAVLVATAAIWMLQSSPFGDREDLTASSAKQPPRDKTDPLHPVETGGDRIPVEPASHGLTQRDAPFSGSTAAPPGWLVQGVVRDEKNLPVEGAGVVVCLEARDESRYPFEPALSNGAGQYTIDAPLPWDPARLSLASTFSGTLIGRAGKGGFFSEPEEQACTLDLCRGAEVVRLDLVIHTDPMLHGTVLTDDGKPVSGAAVMVVSPEIGIENEDEPYLTDSRGVYAIPLDWFDEGAYKLVALKPGLGISAALPIEINPEESKEAPDLILNFHESIAGVAEHPDGSPVGGIRIKAFSEHFQETPDHLLPEDFEEMCVSGLEIAIDEEAWTGLPCGSVVTDVAGRFFITGLRPGGYFLSPDFLNQEDDVLRIPCKAGDRNVRVVLDIYTLRLLLLDETGYRIPHAFLDMDGAGGGSAHWVVNGEIRLDVKPGRVQLVARAPKHLKGEKVIDIVEKQYTATEELVLSEVPEGRLRLFVTGPDGTPYSPLSSLSFQMDGDLDTTEVDLEEKKREADGALLIDLPAGRYQPQMCFLDRNRNNPMEMRLPIVLDPVEIVSDMETPFHVNLRLGGRLQVTIHAGDAAPKRNLRIEIIGGNGKRIKKRLSTFFVQGQKRAGDAHRMKPGTQYLSRSLLEPGLYRLSVGAKGFSAPEQEFTITAGRITPVKVWLENER